MLVHYISHNYSVRRDCITNTYSTFDMFQRKRGPTVDLWCSVRNKQVTCPATVRQRGDEFVAGSMGHTHAAEPGVATKLQITAKVGFTLNTYIIFIFHIKFKWLVYMFFYFVFPGKRRRKSTYLQICCTAGGRCHA